MKNPLVFIWLAVGDTDKRMISKLSILINSQMFFGLNACYYGGTYPEKKPDYNRNNSQSFQVRTLNPL